MVHVIMGNHTLLHYLVMLPIRFLMIAQQPCTGLHAYLIHYVVDNHGTRGPDVTPSTASQLSHLDLMAGSAKYRLRFSPSWKDCGMGCFIFRTVAKELIIDCYPTAHFGTITVISTLLRQFTARNVRWVKVIELSITISELGRTYWFVKGGFN